MPYLDRAATPGLCLVALAMLAASAGCGSGHPKTVAVSGRVTVNGKPLPSGDIQLVPEKGRPAFGTIAADGRFVLGTFEDNDGAPKGTYKVVVTAFETLGAQNRTLVPDRYSSPQTSDKTVTIDGPTDALGIDLTWGSERPRIYPRPRTDKPISWGSGPPP